MNTQTIIQQAYIISIVVVVSIVVFSFLFYLEARLLKKLIFLETGRNVSLAIVMLHFSKELDKLLSGDGNVGADTTHLVTDIRVLAWSNLYIRLAKKYNRSYNLAAVAFIPGMRLLILRSAVNQKLSS